MLQLHQNDTMLDMLKKGLHDVIRLLLTDSGRKDKTKDNFNNTALISASQNDHHDAVKLFLSVHEISAR